MYRTQVDRQAIEGMLRDCQHPIVDVKYSTNLHHRRICLDYILLFSCGDQNQKNTIGTYYQVTLAPYLETPSMCHKTSYPIPLENLLDILMPDHHVLHDLPFQWRICPFRERFYLQTNKQTQ